jgi:hypothetical protein
MNHLFFQINPLEGFFFGSGKAMVVAGVAIIILIGLGLWLFRMESRLQRLNDALDERLNDAQNQPS